MEYLVTWAVNINAASPREAAVKALEMQRDPDSLAVVFEVTNEGAFRARDRDAVTVDLLLYDRVSNE